MTQTPQPLRTHGLDRILTLALGLSGASYGAVLDGSGAVLAAAGSPPKAPAALPRLAREYAQPHAVADVRAEAGAAVADGIRFFASAPIPGSGSPRIGTLVVCARERRPVPERFERTLGELAALAGDLISSGEDRSREERETVLAEIDHRVKNVLAAVQSVASQSARRAVSLDGFLKAMASAQELLTASRWRGAAIHDLATAMLSTLAPGQTRWEGPDLFLTPRAANALALALHELAVNAVRHGALSTESGHVDVRWGRRDGGGFELDWIESGGPQVSPPTRRGFGSLLLEEVTPRELDGEATTDFRTAGLRVRITGSARVMADQSPDEPEPARAPQADATAAGASHGPPAPGKAGKVEGMRVIIVEDAILLAMELEAGLQEAGAEVLGSAALVEEAMALVDLPMDAAVLDCNLNGSSVEPVARALADRGVPFLFATGYGENRGAPEGFDAPIVRKPYDVAQIAAALAELTGRT